MKLWKLDLNNKPRFSIVTLAIFVAIFVLIGIYLIYRLFAATTFDMMDGTVTVATDKTVQRISGTDSYTEAVAISKKMYPLGAAPAVVLGTPTVVIEEVQAGILAGALKSPVLLTDYSVVPASSMAELKRLNPSKVYIVGTGGTIGPNIPLSVKSALPNASVESITGLNPNDLAASVGQKLMKLNDPNNTNPNGVLSDRTVMVMHPAASYLGIGGYLAGVKKYPIFYASTTVPVELKNFIAANGVAKTIVVGANTGVTDAVKAQLPGPVRVDGGDRYTVSNNLLNFSYKGLDSKSYGPIYNTEVGLINYQKPSSGILAAPFMISKFKPGGLLLDAQEAYVTTQNQLKYMLPLGLKTIYVFATDGVISNTSVLKYANILGSDYTAQQIEAQRLVDGYIKSCPILSGTVADFGDARGYQAITYYTSGRIVISPTHTATLERIIGHEIYHVYDYRDNGRIDWGEIIPPRVKPTCMP